MYHMFFFAISAVPILNAVRPVVAFKQFLGVVDHELNFHKYCRWEMAKIKMSAKVNALDIFILKPFSVTMLPVGIC